MEEHGEWRNVTGQDGLRISSNGYVQLRKRGGFWTSPYLPNPNGNGYCLVIHGNCRFRVHVLVARAFLGAIPDGCTVDHIDRNRQNNCVCNLRYATKHEQSLNRTLSGSNKIVDEGEGTDGEEFRESIGHMSVSQFGRILNRRTGRRYTPRLNHEGYRKVTIGRRLQMVHRLVAEAWPDIVGDKPADQTMTIDHIDRDRANNAAQNLRWASKSQQAKNRNRLPSAQTNRITDWVAVDVCAPDEDEWTQYPTMMQAAKAMRNRLGAGISHTQISLFVRKSPSGRVATKGIFKGWKLRLAGNGTLTPNDLQLLRRARSSYESKRSVSFRPPGSSDWTECKSMLEASKLIKLRFGVSINSGSISRCVDRSADGCHTLTHKQNAGWSFKK